jgi:glycosyltransferase involved in cell wall biosynthesis
LALEPRKGKLHEMSGEELVQKDSQGISILIPAYNASSTIGATLLSAILTKPMQSEVLVYLDGGETHSKTLSWLEKRRLICVIRPGYRAGVSMAMNQLIALARFDIVARLDADDIALPFRYHAAIRNIRKNKSDLVFASSILFGNKLRFPRFFPQFPFRITPTLAPYFLWLSNPFVHSTMVANKQVLLDAGGYADVISDDYELFLRLAAKGIRFERTRGFGVLYRVHAGQLSGQADFQSRVDSDPLIQKRLEELEETLTLIGGSNSLESLEVQIRRLLSKESLGFRARTRFLNPLVSFVLRWTGLEARLK